MFFISSELQIRLESQAGLSVGKAAVIPIAIGIAKGPLAGYPNYAQPNLKLHPERGNMSVNNAVGMNDYLASHFNGWKKGSI